MCSPLTQQRSKVHRRENWRETITAGLENKIHGLQQIFHMMLNCTLWKEIIILKKTNICVLLILWEPDSQSDWQIPENASQEFSEPLRPAFQPSCITWAMEFHSGIAASIQNMVWLTKFNISDWITASPHLESLIRLDCLSTSRILATKDPAKQCLQS